MRVCNKTSCLPLPPIFHPQLVGYSITPLLKTPPCSSTSLLVNKEFLSEPLREVLFNTYTFNRKNGLGITDTLLKYGNMEY